jgi:hypothetical protein
MSRHYTVGEVKFMCRHYTVGEVKSILDMLSCSWPTISMDQQRERIAWCRDKCEAIYRMGRARGSSQSVAISNTTFSNKRAVRPERGRVAAWPRGRVARSSLVRHPSFIRLCARAVEWSTYVYMAYYHMCLEQ